MQVGRISGVGGAVSKSIDVEDMRAISESTSINVKVVQVMKE